MRVGGYEFAAGARFQSGAILDANVVGQHLELLRQREHGEITPEDVLNDARNPNSPLHSFFEWDDSAAAESHRIAQARGLIRSVVAIYVDDVKPATRVRAYVHIPEPGAPHYRDTGQALSHAKTRKMVLERAWREFQQWRKRYEDMKEFADLFATADEVGKKILKAAKQR
jgi:hypothetical protein